MPETGWKTITVRDSVYAMLKEKADEQGRSVTNLAEFTILASVIKVTNEDGTCSLCGKFGEPIFFDVNGSYRFRCSNKHGPKGLPFIWFVEPKKGAAKK